MGGCSARHGPIQVPPPPSDRSGDVAGPTPADVRRVCCHGCGGGLGLSRVGWPEGGVGLHPSLVSQGPRRPIPLTSANAELEWFADELQSSIHARRGCAQRRHGSLCGGRSMASAVVAGSGCRYCRIDAYRASCIRLRSNGSSIRASSSHQIIKIETDPCSCLLALHAALSYREPIRCSLVCVAGGFARGVRVRLGPRVCIGWVLDVASQKRQARPVQFDGSRAPRLNRQPSFWPFAITCPGGGSNAAIVRDNTRRARNVSKTYFSLAVRPPRKFRSSPWRCGADHLDCITYLHWRTKRGRILRAFPGSDCTDSY